MGRANSCNVLSAGEARRELWRFTRNGNRCTPVGQKSLPLTAPLPSSWVAKGWSHLWNPKLNVAWLPADKVFLRVLHLPPCEDHEIAAMVEFQMEKVSPLPLAQIVWTVEKVPSAQTAPGTPRTVLVLVAARHVVEDFLGPLEAGGYQTDRMELPAIHELIGAPVTENSAWVYPQVVNEQVSCLIAWWFDGMLQMVSLLNLSTPENWEQELQDQVTKVAWAGEVEGWFMSAPKWHLVADEKQEAAWLPMMQKVAEASVTVKRPKTTAELAALSAVHAIRNGLNPGLLPQEKAVRYQQQFSERLWMRGLGAVGLLYCIFVVIYLMALEGLKYQKNDLQGKITGLDAEYDKALRLAEKINVVEMQINLRFAALETWKAVAVNLPEGLTLSDLAFDRGQRVNIIGGSDRDPVTRLADFSEKLSSLKINGKPLFKTVTQGGIQRGGNGQWRWTFSCELAGVAEK